MSGIIPLYKPMGMTSFKCVSKIRGIVHQKKVGHSGTLDPNVDGVLPICLGHGTKIVDYLMASGKIYRGAITLGFATTTEDLDGEIVAENHDFTPLTTSQIETGFKNFVGETIQIPPMFSAIKVKGRRLYDYARNGEKVERPKRTIKIDYFKQLGESIIDEATQTQTIFFEVKCGKGTYVRTLAVDFGKQFNIPAVMSQLTRTESGGFDLNQTVTFSQLEAASKHGELEKLIYPIDYALKAYPRIELSKSQWELVQHGGFIDTREVNTTEAKIVLGYNEKIRALYYKDVENNRYKPFKMFNLD
ncbi:tRNA pseudouridine(55) synthase TruB [Fructilactobacillus lindneri]|uniref:tRNA pseudouridine synthase B n=1 Tax=Fructilactobacillus lindneri TaxID=53444 RepID=A0AB33BLJ1_9LACO|nr:tRNA pseudouridine(55) synthase [Fructilactobacillus lindneri]POH24938.1 tRNA pseudouridine(55) synthase TruB [Fructilactobacillus lindneri DSM 20690 = JCM 11027]ANZ59841.1 tRNA pseudouridine(55) synthase [Fructilactobacillus lindneri]POG98928.1 tRNA pseudouridine(55) synthase TruB [Fructilactobacillus lindneri]POH03133.1 tRNA pseudouridine(55) synthase TruB [Fructilactobacillus lindneri]